MEPGQYSILPKTVAEQFAFQTLVGKELQAVICTGGMTEAH